MIEGAVIAIIGSYALGWMILKTIHYFDHRTAEKLRAKRPSTEVDY
jgi:hypothetical protein